MTFLPGTEGETVSLVCDTCGQKLGTINRWSDIETVWPLLVARGWLGTPRAQGPHACPRCTGVPSQRVLAMARLGSHRAPQPCRAHLEVLDDAVLVVASGDIHQDTLVPVWETLSAAVATQRDIIVDLGEVGVIDSAGLGILVRAYGEAKQGGRVLCFAAPSRFVRIVLHTMRLDSAILVFDDRRMAQTWLSLQRFSLEKPG